MIYTLINGIDQSKFVGTISITKRLTSCVDSASFIMNSPTTVPVNGNNVQIYLDTTSQTLFGGLITNLSISTLAPGEFKYTCDCTDYQRLLDRRLVNYTYADSTTIDTIIDDLVANWTDPAIGFTTNNVAANFPIIGEMKFNYRTVSDCLREMAESMGYEWYVDEYKDIHFFGKSTINAPYQITDATLRTIISDFVISSDNTRIRNYVRVEGGWELSDSATQIITCNGTDRAWLLLKQPKTITATLNTVPLVLGRLNIDVDDGTYDYFYSYLTRTFSCATGEPTPANGSVLAIPYTYESPGYSLDTDPASIAALAAAEGGDGTYQYIVKDNSIETETEADRYADVELNRNSKSLISGSFTTFTYGFIPGQNIVVNITGHPYNGKYLIREVKIECVGNNIIQYAVSIEGAKEDLLELLLYLARKPAFPAKTTVTWNTNEIDSISGGWIASLTALYLDGATDALSSGMSPVDYPFYAGKKYASRATAPFRVDPSGALTASNATITGAITATTGAIGGWVVDATSIKDAAGVVGLSSAVTGGDDIRFWAGNITPASALFSVTKTGVLKARLGDIGGWSISETYLYKDAATDALSSGLSTLDYPFYAGKKYIDRATAPFRVSTAGTITANSGTIGGFTLSTTALYAGTTTTRIQLDTTAGIHLGATAFADALFSVSLAGALTAKSGTIAGWSISLTSIYKDAATDALSSGMASADYPFYAGKKYVDRATAPFRVDPSGALTATSGTIGGFTLSSTALYAGTTTSRIQLDTTAGIHLGATAFADAPFSVTKAGVLLAKSGVIAGWDLSLTSIYKDGATDALSSGMASADYPFYAGKKYTDRATSPFRVGPSGALIASNATITGVITANTGKIGGATGWVITSENIKDVAGVVGMSSTVTGGDDIRFWAGNATPTSALFSVTKTGTLKARLGEIAGWSISETYIYKDAATDALSSGMACLDYPFYAGKKYLDRATAPFRVTPAGALTATSATITGAITATSGTFTGTINATSGKFGTATDYWSVRANGLTAVAAGTDVFINFGKADFGADASNGFILGFDFSALKSKFEIGSSATKIFKYNGTDLTMTGGSITGGTIIGSTIETDTGAVGHYKRIKLLASDNTLRFYNSTNVNVLTIDDALYGNYAGMYLYYDVNNHSTLLPAALLIGTSDGSGRVEVTRTVNGDGDIGIFEAIYSVGKTGNFFTGWLEDVLKFYVTQAGVVDVAGGYKVGSTEIINSSKAIVGVTGITVASGNIVLSGANATVDGVDVSAHKARHENGGADEISVAGLSGALADAQPTSGLTGGKVFICDAYKGPIDGHLHFTKRTYTFTDGRMTAVSADTDIDTGITYP